MTSLTKYIIAFLALPPEDYTFEAQKHFADNAVGYILGSECLPHITICQFYTDQETLLHIQEDIQEEFKTCPQPAFTGLGFIKDNTDPAIWWAELSVARHLEIMHQHHTTVKILENYGCKSINDSGDLYRPHLTLARVNRVSITDFPVQILNPSPFALILGKAGPLGQLLKVKYIF